MGIIGRPSMKYAILNRDEVTEEIMNKSCDCFYKAIGSPCGQYVPIRFEDIDAPDGIAYTTEELFMNQLTEWGYIQSE